MKLKRHDVVIERDVIHRCQITEDKIIVYLYLFSVSLPLNIACHKIAIYLVLKTSDTKKTSYLNIYFIHMTLTL